MTNTLTSLSILEPTPMPWSEVRSNGRAMRYRRSGAGAPILLLGATPESPSPLLPAALMDALAARFRLILPELSPGPAPASCLADFLEALGTIQVTVLAVGSFCMPAVELAFRELDQLERLVLMPEGEPNEDAPETGVCITVGKPRIPALILRPGLSIDQSLSAVTSFVLDT